jgi:GT2 family glycosyltransferase
MTISVIIVTLNRPDCVRQCLDCLMRQTRFPEQILVVDSSTDDLTQTVVQEFTGVIYLRNPKGFARMTASRNLGLLSLSGDIAAFLDDDSFAHPTWLASLAATYDSPEIGCVGGRALRGQAGEADQGSDEIGLLKSDGSLTGNFAADSGRPIPVDHVMGCNMSYRRSVLAHLGGFREDYGGISGVREDTDMCLRVRQAGWQIIFQPLACVDHIGAPQAKGQRFDTRYAYYSERNHLILLIRNFGLFAPRVRGYLQGLFRSLRHDFQQRSFLGASVRTAARLVGVCVGIGRGVWLLRLGRSPQRRDRAAQILRERLELQGTKR